MVPKKGMIYLMKVYNFSSFDEFHTTHTLTELSIVRFIDFIDGMCIVEDILKQKEDVCFSSDLKRLPVNNSLNKKLYPKNKEWEGFLVPAKIAEELKKVNNEKK